MEKNIYKPQPIDTSKIILTKELKDLAEMLAKNAHDVWAVKRLEDGWTYGEERSNILKTTPCLIAYEALEECEKVYDRDMALETIKVLLAYGFTISKEKSKGGHSR